MCIILIPAFTLTKLQKTANLVVKTLSGPACFTATILEYCPKHSYTQIYSVKGCRGHIFFPVLIPTSSYLRCYTTWDSDRKIVCKHLGKIISTKSKRWAGQWLSFFRAIQILQQPGIYFVCVLLQCTPLCCLPKKEAKIHGTSGNAYTEHYSFEHILGRIHMYVYMNVQYNVFGLN